MIRLVMLLGGTKGPWIKTGGMSNCIIRVRGLSAGKLMVCQTNALDPEDNQIRQVEILENGDHKVDEAYWMCIQAEGTPKSVLCQVLGQERSDAL